MSSRWAAGDWRLIDGGSLHDDAVVPGDDGLTGHGVLPADYAASAMAVDAVPAMGSAGGCSVASPAGLGLAPVVRGVGAAVAGCCAAAAVSGRDEGAAGRAGDGRSLDMGSCLPTGFSGIAAAGGGAAAEGGGAGKDGWAAGCGCAQGVSAWHLRIVRSMSVDMRYSERALPYKRSARLCGVSGSTARRRHSMEA